MSSKNFQEKLIGLQGNLLNFAYILTSNRDDAQDLLQDTTLRALDNEDKYVDNVNFKGWVFTIHSNQEHIEISCYRNAQNIGYIQSTYRAIPPVLHRP